MLHSICQHIWKIQQWPQDCKRSVFIPIPKIGNAKEWHCHTTAHISHASKVMFKILQARLQQNVNQELPHVQAVFRKRQRNQRSNYQYPLDHRKSKRIPEKHLILLYWLHQTLWQLWSNCGKIWKRWEYQTTWPASWEICMQVKKQQLEPDVEQQTGSKLGKEDVKTVYCHPAYLTYL